MNHAPVHLGPRELREVYAEPFAAAIRDAGLASIMNSYSSIDGIPCAGSAAILDDLLRDELGFDGRRRRRLLRGDAPHDPPRGGRHAGRGGRSRPARRSRPRAARAGLLRRTARAAHRRWPTRDRRGRHGGAPGVALEVPGRPVRGSLRRRGPRRRGVRHVRPIGRWPAGRPPSRSCCSRTRISSCRSIRTQLTSIAVIGPAADDQRLLQGDYHYPAHLEISFDNSAGSDVAADTPEADDGPSESTVGGEKFLGLSGGIDSALVALIAADALGPRAGHLRDHALPPLQLRDPGRRQEDRVQPRLQVDRVRDRARHGRIRGSPATPFRGDRAGDRRGEHAGAHPRQPRHGALQQVRLAPPEHG